MPSPLGAHRVLREGANRHADHYDHLGETLHPETVFHYPQIILTQ